MMADHGKESCHASMEARAASDARLSELAAMVKGATGEEKVAAADALAAEVTAQMTARKPMACAKPAAHQPRSGT
jgi:hypothetical protein